MAVIHAKQTGVGANSTLTLPATATAGNELVVIVSMTATTSAPTVAFTEGGGGTTGVTVEATHAIFNASGSSVWVAHKVAAGAEISISVTPPAGGTVQGMTYIEVSGGPYEVESVFHSDNVASAKTASSPSVTTLNAGDVLFAGVSTGSNTGAISAWSGTGPMTNVAAGAELTVGTRCIGGYYVPGEKLTGATFTANWETAKGSGLVGIVLKLAPVLVGLNAAASLSGATGALTASTGVALAAGASTSASSLAMTAPPQPPLQAAASQSAASAAITATLRLPLQTASSASSTSLDMTASTAVPLQPAPSSSTASAALSAATQLLLSTSSSTSAASARVSTLASVPLATAASTSSASMALTTPYIVVLAPAQSSSSASLGLTILAVTALNSASSSSTAELALFAPRIIPHPLTVQLSDTALMTVAMTDEALISVVLEDSPKR